MNDRIVVLAVLEHAGQRMPKMITRREAFTPQTCSQMTDDIIDRRNKRRCWYDVGVPV
jgi:hypothetical protein